MDRAGIENILKENGFTSRKLQNDEVTYVKEGKESVDIIINETEDLYCNCMDYLRIEVNDQTVCIRLYHEYNYIGCIIKSYDEIETFEIDEWEV